MALTELLKPLIDRTLTGFLSFPSRHTTGIFAVVVAFAVLLIDPPRPRIRAVVRVLLALIALLAAATVAVALVAVRWHYATDTVAGAAVGTAVVLATALTLDLVCAWSGRRLSSRPAAEWMGRRAPRIANGARVLLKPGKKGPQPGARAAPAEPPASLARRCWLLRHEVARGE